VFVLIGESPWHRQQLFCRRHTLLAVALFFPVLIALIATCGVRQWLATAFERALRDRIRVICVAVSIPQVLRAVALFICATVGAQCLAQPARFQLLELNGLASNRISVVFLSEGYTASQSNAFALHATNALNALFSWEPCQHYRAGFNASMIFVASRQSGSDHPASGVKHDTYFNSTFDSSDRVITIPLDANGQGKVDDLLANFVPDCSLAILLVNDLTPGGSDGFGRTAICSVAASSADILRHETGHVIANLGDEYDSPNPGFPNTEEPNTTRETRLAFLKWKNWVDPATPLPTAPTFDFVDTIGLFEGAHYHSSGWYRPRLNCAMREIVVPFCEICREALVLSFYAHIRPVDAWAPASHTVSLTGSIPLTLRVDTVPVESLAIQWRTNATPVPAATNRQFTIGPQLLNTGSNQVSVTVRDITPCVRTDPAGALSQTIEWTLQVQTLPLVLDSAAFEEGSQFIFRVLGNAPAGFVIESSTDFQNWNGKATNPPLAGQVWITNSVTSSRQYFRALTL
jgi:hypothetical protein